MRELTERVGAVLVAFAVLSAAGFGAVHMDGPEPVDPVGESEALVLAAIGIVGAVGIATGTVGVCAFGNCIGSATAASELEGLEAQEAHNQIWLQGTQTAEQQEIFLASASNHQEDGSEIALMEGKNGFIRGVQSGNTTSGAIGFGQDQSDNWYSARQVNMLNQWNVAAQTLVAQAESYKSGSIGDVNEIMTVSGMDSVPINTTETEFTLINGSTVTLHTIHFESGTSTFDRSPFQSEHITGSFPDGYNVLSSSSDIKIKGPDAESESVVAVDASEWQDLAGSYRSAASTTRSQLQTFGNSAYTAIQNDEIETSDLVDPYLSAREYSPEGDYGSWALRSLTAAGYRGPVNLSQTRKMNVSTGGTTYEGVLLSDSTPSGGKFMFGTEYSPSGLGGPQTMILRNGSSKNITQPFTVESAFYQNGTKMQKDGLAYETAEYDTSSVSGYAEKLDRYNERDAEIDARQSALIGGGGGPLGNVGIGAAGAVVVLGGIVWFARSRD